MNDPISTHDVNISGFLNMLVAARDAEVAQLHLRGVAARPTATIPACRRSRTASAQPLSPYAVTKYVNELYAAVFARTYGFNTIGLRYFNVFGKRQDPDGAYAAVIPEVDRLAASTARMSSSTATARRAATSATSTTSCRRTCSRRFRMRRAATRSTTWRSATARRSTSSTTACARRSPTTACRATSAPCTAPFRTGDVRHSQANVEKAERLLGYGEKVPLAEGLARAMPWYIQFVSQR